ncbi:hypothetical protein [Oscillibacter sp.]|uniref:hypothetical protein n=1 Tax=Oscillibacter sp. TaxID=1945593 RepID=UPI002D7E2854|nr:hypothetical protein [Oscillibacter sp.]
MKDNPWRRRLNLSFSMAMPLQREAWEILHAVPSRQRTDAVCRAICQTQERDALLEAVRSAIREELQGVEILSAKEKTEQPQAGDVDDNILGFLLALQNDGGEDD